MFFQKILPWVADTTPSTFGRHPFYKKGNIRELLPTLPRSHFGRHPFVSAGNLDRSLVLISRNGMICNCYNIFATQQLFLEKRQFLF